MGWKPLTPLEGSMAHATRNLETRWEDPGLLGYEYTSFKNRVFLSELQGNVRLKTMS